MGVLTVRAARAEDGPALAALDRATWSPTVTPAARPAADRPFTEDPARFDDVLVAQVEEGVVGYVALHQAIPLSTHQHVLEINGLAVDLAHQGMGVGRRLIEVAKREAAGRGVLKLSLRVLAPNTPAPNLYAACGFEVEGVRRGEFLIDGCLVDDVLMACPLEPRSPS